jgi:hypothetical protein
MKTRGWLSHFAMSQFATVLLPDFELLHDAQSAKRTPEWEKCGPRPSAFPLDSTYYDPM